MNDRLVLRFMGQGKLGKAVGESSKDMKAIPNAKPKEAKEIKDRGRVRDVVAISPKGKVKVRGTVMALGYQELSDGRLKESVEPIAGALERVHALHGVTYQWKNRTFPFEEQIGMRQMGFVAQDVERIFPEVVSTDEQGFKSIDYGRLTPALIEAFKQQQSIIEDQRVRLERLEMALERLGALPMTKATSKKTPKARDQARAPSTPSKTPRADRPARGPRR